MITRTGDADGVAGDRFILRPVPVRNQNFWPNLTPKFIGLIG